MQQKSKTSPQTSPPEDYERFMHDADVQSCLDGLVVDIPEEPLFVHSETIASLFQTDHRVILETLRNHYSKHIDDRGSYALVGFFGFEFLNHDRGFTMAHVDSLGIEGYWYRQMAVVREFKRKTYVKKGHALKDYLANWNPDQKPKLGKIDKDFTKEDLDEMLQAGVGAISNLSDERVPYFWLVPKKRKSIPKPKTEPTPKQAETTIAAPETVDAETKPEPEKIGPLPESVLEKKGPQPEKGPLSTKEKGPDLVGLTKTERKLVQFFSRSPLEPGDRMTQKQTSKAAKIPARSLKRAVQMIQQDQGQLGPKLQALGIQYVSNGQGRGNEAYFTVMNNQ